jgi:predicted nucleic acid-binding Zn ribbon protein
MPRDRDDSTGAERLSDALTRYMEQSGFKDRMQQMQVMSQWAALLGPEIGSISRPISISADGTLFAVAKTSAWVNELTMMERELLASLNRATGARPLQRIRWAVSRER